MSFFTALTGLNAATAQLGVTANNIANAGTIGFKRSRTDFGDIFATSPLQKASSTVGQGVSLKRVTQEFSQGNVSFSSNTLDLAITGDGFTDAADHAALRKDGLGALDGLGLPAAAAGDQERG